MAASKTTITGPVYLADCSKPQDAVISFELSSWDQEVGEALFVSGPYTAALDVNGDFTSDIWTTAAGENAVVYRVYVSYLSDLGLYKREFLGTIGLSGVGPYKLADLAFITEWDPNSFDVLATVAADRLAVETLSVSVTASEAKAKQWAEEAEDVEVETGQFSALHHSAKAAAEVVLAQAQVTLAAAQVALADAARVAAELAETNAETAETNAAASAASINATLLNDYYTQTVLDAALLLKADLAAPSFTGQVDLVDAYITGRVQQDIIAASPGPSVVLDFDLGNIFEMTLDQNVSFSNPDGIILTPGQWVMVILRQDGTGSRLASWGSKWLFPGGTAPTLSTGANAIDIIAGQAISSTEILCNSVLEFA